MTFREAGYAPGRTRLIVGRALDVLQRLTPGGYDLVFVDSAHIEYPGCYELGVSLLRRGGIIAFHNVLAGGRVIDPSHRDPETLALREVARRSARTNAWSRRCFRSAAGCWSRRRSEHLSTGSSGCGQLAELGVPRAGQGSGKSGWRGPGRDGGRLE